VDKFFFFFFFFFFLSFFLYYAIYGSTQAHNHEQLTTKIHQNYI